jgi:putative Ca2+/H+ antiporter (TMEM165/GDT1 family)
MVLIFFTAFGAVFVAEIVGDKLLYTTGVLAARYRTLPIMIGMMFAFMAKMGVAVLVGEAISRLPAILVASITALSFLGVAFTLWRKSDLPKEKWKEQ